MTEPRNPVLGLRILRAGLCQSKSSPAKDLQGTQVRSTTGLVNSREKHMNAGAVKQQKTSFKTSKIMAKLKNEIGALRKAVRAGVKEFREASKPSSYSAAGIQIECPHCQGKEFELGKALLRVTVPTLTTLVCSVCGTIQWFAKAPDRL